MRFLLDYFYATQIKNVWCAKKLSMPNLIKLVTPVVGYQTITLWIYHVHPTRKKRAGNRLNLTLQ